MGGVLILAAQVRPQGVCLFLGGYPNIKQCATGLKVTGGKIFCTSWRKILCYDGACRSSLGNVQCPAPRGGGWSDPLASHTKKLLWGWGNQGFSWRTGLQQEAEKKMWSSPGKENTVASCSQKNTNLENAWSQAISIWTNSFIIMAQTSGLGTPLTFIDISSLIIPPEISQESTKSWLGHSGTPGKAIFAPDPIEKWLDRWPEGNLRSRITINGHNCWTQLDIFVGRIWQTMPWSPLGHP